MNTERKFLIILFITTLVIRTFYVYQTFHKIGDSNWSDAKIYTFYGKEFAKGNFYPILPETNQKLLIPPVIPMVYALFQLVFPDNYWPFFIYNILLTSFIVVLLYYIGKMLWNKYLGYIIAIWGVLFFDYMKYTPTILKEPTLCFLLVLLVFLLLKYQQNDKLYKYLFAIGLSFIVLIHTDERYFAFLPMILILPFIHNQKISFNKKDFYQFLVLGAFIFLLMIPWTVRNYKEYNEIVLLSPRTTAITSKFWGTNQSVINFEGDSRAYQLMESRIENAKEYAAQYGIEPRIQKGFESKLMAFINFWQPTYFKPTFIQYGYRFQKWSVMHNLTSIFFYGIFLPFFILGLIRYFIKGNALLIWLGCIPIIHSLVHAYMVWPVERYRMPINFIIVLIALIYIFDLLERKKRLNILSKCVE
jgi:4-amino-4-deoxy-L-arabinose transferase-like glycosyltransferase